MDTFIVQLFKKNKTNTNTKTKQETSREDNNNNNNNNNAFYLKAPFKALKVTRCVWLTLIFSASRTFCHFGSLPYVQLQTHPKDYWLIFLST